jgi:hypothetical protein
MLQAALLDDVETSSIWQDFGVWLFSAKSTAVAVTGGAAAAAKGIEEPQIFISCGTNKITRGR